MMMRRYYKTVKSSKMMIVFQTTGTPEFVGEMFQKYFMTSLKDFRRLLCLPVYPTRTKVMYR
jgi:hypothetical protein